jgi:Na+/H+ antiporter NhaB
MTTVLMVIVSALSIAVGFYILGHRVAVSRLKDSLEILQSDRYKVLRDIVAYNQSTNEDFKKNQSIPHQEHLKKLIELDSRITHMIECISTIS